MRGFIKKMVLLLVFLAQISTVAYAHPGGIDSSGGHYVRTAGWGYPVGSYHYHGGGTSDDLGSSSYYGGSYTGYNVTGLSSKEVGLIQTVLNELGYDCGTPDGIFGSKTYSAIILFQIRNGLNVDGVIGDQTLDKMIELTSNMSSFSSSNSITGESDTGVNRTTSITISDSQSAVVNETSYFTIGSLKEHVMAVMGSPDSVSATSWIYDFSTIYFVDGSVSGWSDISHNLKASIGEKVLGKVFTIGSSMEDVVHAMGTPDNYSATSWGYDFSSVYFTNGVVTGWSNISNNLNVSIGHKVTYAAPFTIGSKVSDVVNAMGTPDDYSTTSMGYGFSSVYFTNGKVSGWSDISDNLYVSIGVKDKSAPPIEVGSTMKDVVKAMGTPDSFSWTSWGYDFSSVYFYNGVVTGWSNISNNLKID